VLDRPRADERSAFLKAMDMLEAEFRTTESLLENWAEPADRNYSYFLVARAACR
jgi:hypothetical protein